MMINALLNSAAHIQHNQIAGEVEGYFQLHDIVAPNFLNGHFFLPFHHSAAMPDRATKTSIKRGQLNSSKNSFTFLPISPAFDYKGDVAAE